MGQQQRYRRADSISNSSSRSSGRSNEINAAMPEYVDNRRDYCNVMRSWKLPEQTEQPTHDDHE